VVTCNNNDNNISNNLYFKNQSVDIWLLIDLLPVSLKSSRGRTALSTRATSAHLVGMGWSVGGMVGFSVHWCGMQSRSSLSVSCLHCI